MLTRIEQPFDGYLQEFSSQFIIRELSYPAVVAQDRVT